MAEILVLAIDRDNDFGYKGNVKTPVIGIDKITNAVLALGIADPEDSDVNALLAAISIYKDLEREGKSVEIALICGDIKVGHKSDLHIIKELDTVIKTTNPKRSILVDDGVEDSLVYPIISSHIAIDSVRRVYVKQSPGIEGLLYIVKKTVAESQKSKRLLAPLGIMLIILSLTYISAFELFTRDVGETVSIFISSVVLTAGFIILLYSNDTLDKIIKQINKCRDRAEKSGTFLIFILLSITAAILYICSLVTSLENLSRDIPTTPTSFPCAAVWLLSFAAILITFGKFLNEYATKKKKNFTTVINSELLLGLALTAQNLISFVVDFGSLNLIILGATGMNLILVTGTVLFSKLQEKIDGVQ